jgi:hypothetical protein
MKCSILEGLLYMVCSPFEKTQCNKPFTDTAFSAELKAVHLLRTALNRTERQRFISGGYKYIGLHCDIKYKLGSLENTWYSSVEIVHM